MNVQATVEALHEDGAVEPVPNFKSANLPTCTRRPRLRLVRDTTDELGRPGFVVRAARAARTTPSSSRCETVRAAPENCPSISPHVPYDVAAARAAGRGESPRADRLGAIQARALPPRRCVRRRRVPPRGGALLGGTQLRWRSAAPCAATCACTSTARSRPRRRCSTRPSSRRARDARRGPGRRRRVPDDRRRARVPPPASWPRPAGRCRSWACLVRRRRLLAMPARHAPPLGRSAASGLRRPLGLRRVRE